MRRFTLTIFILLSIINFCCAAKEDNFKDTAVQIKRLSAANSNSEKSVSVEEETKTTFTKTITGVYKRKTSRNGRTEYDNTLAVSEKSGGKFHVTLSGSYAFPAGDEETMHDASGEGDAVLKGSLLLAEIKADEDENPCRVTIAFSAAKAIVKTDDNCEFNVDMNGSYKKDADKISAVKMVPTINPKQVDAAQLYDFINDFKHRRAGEKIIITDVEPSKIAKNSVMDENGKGKYPGLFYLESSEADAGGTMGLVTSRPLIKNLKTVQFGEAIKLRVYAVVLQSKDEFEVLQMPFATKIEGLNEMGKILWTANGAEPEKVSY